MKGQPQILLRQDDLDEEPLVLEPLKVAGFQVEVLPEGVEQLDSPIDLASDLVLVQPALINKLISRNRNLQAENQRLIANARARKLFIRLVTHELKSPIAAVENYLKLILQGYINLTEQEKVLERCIIRTCEERQLIDDLLDLSKAEELEALPVEPVQLDQILELVLSECQYDIEEKALQLSVRVDSQIPPICAVPELMKSLWCNLISNALKYTREGGRISVGLQQLDRQLIGWVEDTGIGISPEDQIKLFQEFFRGAEVRKSGIPGTGLGLVLVRRVLESLDGSIEVNSTLGEGSRFRFFIPLGENRALLN